MEPLGNQGIADIRPFRVNISAPLAPLTVTNGVPLIEYLLSPESDYLSGVNMAVAGRQAM
ncbi:MAG TPA: hypothetical protein VKB88_22755 [Bryobacteraceae bacterium]|nr:hypothetical protein [Bryobacteraceae bacterium]